MFENRFKEKVLLLEHKSLNTVYVVLHVMVYPQLAFRLLTKGHSHPGLGQTPIINLLPWCGHTEKRDPVS